MQNLNHKKTVSYVGNQEKATLNWRIERLDKFIKILSGEYFPYREFVNKGIPVLKIDNVMYGHVNWDNKTSLPEYYSESHKHLVLKEGDIVIALNRPITNDEVKVARLSANDVPSILYQRVGKFEFDGELNIDKQFLFTFLRSQIFKKILSKTLIGSDQPYVKTTELIRQRFTLPSKIEEQEKIASIFSKVDELIQKTDQVIKQTQRLKKGLMQKLLTKGIGHSKFKKTAIGEIPESWDIRQLGEVLDICQYGLSLKLSEQGRYPIFRMNNIKNGYMVTNKMKFIDLDKETFEHYKLEIGDLLFNRTNSSDLVGKIGLFLLKGEYTFASYLIRLRPKRERIDPLFLNFYLNTNIMQDKLRNLATPGVSQVNINAVNLKSVSISIPNISEQERIVTILLSLDKRKQSEVKIKEKFSDLKKGLMQNLLTGKIRIKV